LAESTPDCLGSDVGSAVAAVADCGVIAQATTIIVAPARAMQVLLNFILIA